MIIICIRNMYQLPIPSGLKIVTCKNNEYDNKIYLIC